MAHNTLTTFHCFAGAGGGILADLMLGHTPVGACEIEEYPRECLLARQRDGSLPAFPIWDDINTLDGREWRGAVDILAGGFPCQDISSAGKQRGQSTASDPSCGPSSCEWLAKWHAPSCSWKTAQCSLITGLATYSERFPRWGMMLDGEFGAVPTWEHVTSGNGAGCLLGTPRSCSSVSARLDTPSQRAEHRNPNLETQIARMLPTPCARDWKGHNKPSSITRKDGASRMCQLPNAIAYGTETQEGGFYLNPSFVEEMMAWPIGWADLRPLATDKIQEWQHTHSAHFRVE